MKTYRILSFILLWFFVQAGIAQAPEKRFVGNCQFTGFSLVADSTYQGNITSFSDRFGDGYNASMIAAGYEILDGRGLVFAVDSVISSTYVSAVVRVTAKVNRGFAPFGSGQVYQPTSLGLIPASSVEQAGLSPVSKARIDRHNMVQLDSFVRLGIDTVYSITYVPDTSWISPNIGDAFVNAGKDTMGLYDGGQWVLFFGNDGNGIISALPDGSVAINGSANDLTIQTTGTVVIGDGYGDGNDTFFFLSDNNGSIGLESATGNASIRGEFINIESGGLIDIVYTGFGTSYRLIGIDSLGTLGNPLVIGDGFNIAAGAGVDTISVAVPGPDSTVFATLYALQDTAAAIRADFPAVGVTDGDKGDIDVTSSGAVWTIDTNAVTVAKIFDDVLSSVNFVVNDGGNIDLASEGDITVTPVQDSLKIFLDLADGAVDWAELSGAVQDSIQAGGGGGVSGIGTANTIPLWSGSTSLGDSWLSQSGNAVNLDAGTVLSGATGAKFTSNIFECDTPENNSVQLGTGAIEIEFPAIFGTSYAAYIIYFDVYVTERYAQSRFHCSMLVVGGASPVLNTVNVYQVGQKYKNRVNYRASVVSGIPRLWLGELSEVFGNGVAAVKNVRMHRYSVQSDTLKIDDLCTGINISIESSAYNGTTTAKVVGQPYVLNAKLAPSGSGAFYMAGSATPQLGGAYNGNGNYAHEITIPVSSSGTANYSMRLDMHTNSSSTKELLDFTVYGTYYEASKSWNRCRVVWGDGGQPDDSKYVVRFGDDGTNGKIWVGELTSSWTGAFFSVSNLQALYITSAEYFSLLDGTWTVGRESTAFDNVDVTVSPASSLAIPLIGDKNGHIYSSTATSGVLIAKGTTAQRPAGVAGVIRYNTTTSAFEGYSSSTYRAFYQESTADPTSILGKVIDGLAGEITPVAPLSLSSGELSVSQRYANLRKASGEVYAFSTTPELIDTLDGSTAGGLFTNGGNGVLTYGSSANRVFQVAWSVTFSCGTAEKEVTFEIYEAGAASTYNKATQYAAAADKRYSLSGIYNHTANNTDTFDIRGYIDSGTANVTIHNISIVFTEM